MSGRIENITQNIIEQLYNHGEINKAALSSLRKSTSITSKQATSIWPILLANMDKDDLSNNGYPTHAEIAIFTAVRCYAIFQQGNDQNVFASSENSSDRKDVGLTLFQALAKLRQDETIQKALDRRVQSLLASNEVNNIIESLIHLLEILKSHYKYLKIDYAVLAQDLFRFQFNTDSAREVSLMWGEQYFHVDKKN